MRMRNDADNVHIRANMCRCGAMRIENFGAWPSLILIIVMKCTKADRGSKERNGAVKMQKSGGLDFDLLTCVLNLFSLENFSKIVLRFICSLWQFFTGFSAVSE